MWCPQTWVCEYFYIPVRGQIQLWTPFSRPEGFRLRELPLHLIHLCLCFDLQSSQVKGTPPRFHWWIYYSKIESVGSCRFQIHLCILACMMGREFSRKAVTKFLPAQFPWIWCKYLLTNFIHWKIFNLTKYREVLVKYSLLITHAGRPKRIWHQSRERLTDSFFK